MNKRFNSMLYTGLTYEAIGTHTTESKSVMIVTEETSTASVLKYVTIYDVVLELVAMEDLSWILNHAKPRTIVYCRTAPKEAKDLINKFNSVF